jgi:hypothetical protein
MGTFQEDYYKKTYTGRAVKAVIDAVFQKPIPAQTPKKNTKAIKIKSDNGR